MHHKNFTSHFFFARVFFFLFFFSPSVPGFIQMESRGGEYPDVTCCDAIKLNVMSMEVYDGYRFSFGTKRAKTGFFAQGFKADFDAPLPIGEFGDVIIPFNMFSVEWDEATGDQKITCADDPTVCPDMKTLQNILTMAIWGEGVGGFINIYVKSISAVGCSSSSSSSDATIGDGIPPRTNEAIDSWREKNSAVSSSSTAAVLFETTIITLIFTAMTVTLSISFI
jgi:hypothetical protein